MQMSTGCGGDFTTNASVVVQISKRQDLCRVSFKNPTTPLTFALRKLLLDDIIVINGYYIKNSTELRLEARGVGPIQTDKNS